MITELDLNNKIDLNNQIDLDNLHFESDSDSESKLKDVPVKCNSERKYRELDLSKFQKLITKYRRPDQKDQKQITDSNVLFDGFSELSNIVDFPEPTDIVEDIPTATTEPIAVIGEIGEIGEIASELASFDLIGGGGADANELADAEELEDAEFEWKVMSAKWVTKLDCDSFVIRDCLGDGNCQFRSIANALTDAGYKTTHETLRRKIAKYINGLDITKFNKIIENYRLEVDNREFVGDWDPYSVSKRREFATIVKRPGFSFQGDHVTLSLIADSIGIDFVLFNSDYSIIDVTGSDTKHPKLILLYYDKQKGHYQTIGLRVTTRNRTKITTLFYRNRLPEVLDRILDKTSFFMQHIKRICQRDLQCNNIRLNAIVRHLQNKIQKPLTLEERRMVINLIRVWLDNQGFFEQIRKRSPSNKRGPSNKGTREL